MAEKRAESATEKKKVTQSGDFRVERKLGQGGMGTAFLGTQISCSATISPPV